MQSYVSNVLSDLKTLSDCADQIIYCSYRENQHLDYWFKTIKETANSIVKGTNSKTDEGKSSTSRTSFNKIELPDLITLIKGKQSNARENRVSNFLADVKKDHVRRSNRKLRYSRKSSRKIVLEKKSENRKEVSNSELYDSSKKKDKNDAQITKILETPTNKIKNMTLESNFETPVVFSANKIQKKFPDFSSGLNVKQDDGGTCCIPAENNADATTLMTRSKIKALAATKIVKGNNLKLVSSKCNPSLDSSAQLGNHTGEKSKILETTISTKAPSSDNLIFIDSDDNENSDKYMKTSIRQFKRKSSIQHSQGNAKKPMRVGSKTYGKESERAKRLIICKESQPSKRLKVTKNATNPVMPAKISNTSLAQPNTSLADKRILREIQKKEEIVFQNTQNIKTQREIKIEENKKAREIKMEKALQQRLKIQKEREERVKSRANSKQEITEHKESNMRKKVLKRELQHKAKNNCVDEGEDTSSTNKQSFTMTKTLKLRSDEIVSQSPTKVLENPNFSIKISNEDENNLAKNVTSAMFMKTPVKPVRSITKSTSKNITLALSVETPVKPDAFLAKETTKSSVNNNEIIKVIPAPDDKVFAKPILNVTFASSPSKDNVKSAAKKLELQANVAKTPVANFCKKPIYSMTPSEASFVSYDVSEIKDDDDEEDEEASRIKKPIPCWAQGLRFRNTLLTQYYNPVDTAELFGNYFETPDLVKIMGTQKKHYHKRTSSANWTKSPYQSIMADI